MTKPNVTLTFLIIILKLQFKESRKALVYGPGVLNYSGGGVLSHIARVLSQDERAVFHCPTTVFIFFFYRVSQKK